MLMMMMMVMVITRDLTLITNKREENAFDHDDCENGNDSADDDDNDDDDADGYNPKETNLRIDDNAGDNDEIFSLLQVGSYSYDMHRMVFNVSTLGYIQRTQVSHH